MTTEKQDIPLAERFAFGKNWTDYLTKLNSGRVNEAKEFMKKSFSEGLEGKSFLDIGCGSGLFSLAAKELGAKVVSFDFDPDSVGCTQRLKEQFHPDDKNWDIFEGSVLNDDMMQGLGQFDVVYTWGVLHHTGQMWHAIENAAARVGDDGKLYIAIYNDQGGYSDLWKVIKKVYVKSPDWVRTLLCALTFLFYEGRSLLIQLVRLRNPIKWLRSRRQHRGMAIWNDVRDWVGGYPFEVAKPEEIFEYHRDKGFDLLWLKTNGGGIACNEFIFKKKTD